MSMDPSFTGHATRTGSVDNRHHHLGLGEKACEEQARADRAAGALRRADIDIIGSATREPACGECFEA